MPDREPRLRYIDFPNGRYCHRISSGPSGLQANMTVCGIALDPPYVILQHPRGTYCPTCREKEPTPAHDERLPHLPWPHPPRGPRR